MASRSSRKYDSSASNNHRIANGDRRGSLSRNGRGQAPRGGGRPVVPQGGPTMPPPGAARSRASRPNGASSRSVPTHNVVRGGIPNSGPGISSVRIGDIQRMERQSRNERVHRTYRKHLIRLGIAAAIILALVGAGTAVYFSPAFTIEEIKVEGADHLTVSDMEALTNIPSDTTLLRVNTGAIEKSVDRDAWVQDVTVTRQFPSTLLITVTERRIAAVVVIPVDNAKSTQDWAIADDGMWLMAIPNRDSAVGQTLNPQIYADADEVLHITDVPYGVMPEVGSFCTDENIDNALAIITGLTPELADQVKIVSATDPASTSLTLDNGVEIAFGAAENIAEKERVCLEIMESNPGKVAYINVRVVNRPTWRAA